MRFNNFYLQGNPQSSQSFPFQRIGKQNRRCNLEYPSRGTRNRENLKQFILSSYCNIHCKFSFKFCNLSNIFRKTFITWFKAFGAVPCKFVAHVAQKEWIFSKWGIPQCFKKCQIVLKLLKPFVLFFCFRCQMQILHKNNH